MRAHRKAAETIGFINPGNLGSTGGIARGVVDIARAKGVRCDNAFRPR